MKKSVLCVVFLAMIIFSLTFVLAQNHTEEDSALESDTEGDAVDLAYSCLEEKIDDKNSLSLQEAVFGMLALGGLDKLNEGIEDDKRSSEDCWPNSGCKLKDTAQVLLAYDRTGKNTDGIEKWLLSKNGSVSELTWFIEIDIQNHAPSSCRIKDSVSERTINIGEDMTLSGATGSCLSISPSGYWLKISNSCLDKEYEISRDDDFISTLLYEKSGGETIFVSSMTHSAPSLGTTTEKVGASCFKLGGSCDYEGSLWAAFALKKAGHDVSEFIPYLTALAEDNKRFFPSSLLFLLGVSEEYGNVAQSQSQGGYWQISGTPYNRFYDTSLGMLALGWSGATEFDSARDYLLEVQGNSGCWNSDNIRDTGFILYSGWPIDITRGSGGGSTGNATGGGAGSCISAGLYCENAGACEAAGGQINYGLECSFSGEYCCNVRVAQATCAELNGDVCSSGEVCSGTIVSSVDRSCCVGGSCSAATAENTCTLFNDDGICRTNCGPDESKTSDSCPLAGEVCCIPGSGTLPTKEGNIWIWVLVFGILILLAILGIVYRNKIRVWWYSRKGKIRTTPVSRGGGFGGVLSPGRPGPRFGGGFGGGQMRRPVGRVPSRGGRDSEFEETMKKLKDMSK